MSKSLKPIIISLAVIAVAAIAIVLMVFVFPKTDEADAAASPEPTSAASTSVKIIDEDNNALVSFQMLPEDGDSMLVEIKRDGDNYDYTVTPAAEYFDYDTSKFRSMIYTLTSLNATNLVEENPSDIAQYGLDKPWFTMRCGYEGGRTIELYIGNPTPTDSNYYVSTNQSDSVYTLGSYVVSLLTRSDIDYRQITFFPTYEEDDIYDNINYVRMLLRDGTEIEISLEDVENFSDGNVSKSAYFMTQPVVASCNDTTVRKDVLDVVAKLLSSTYIMDIEDDEYADYGFDNAAELEMTDVAGNHVDILIGNKDETGFYYYTMLKESPGTVILCGADAFEWLSSTNFNYIGLMSRIPWYINIREVESMEYDMDGTEYLVEMEHTTRINANDEEVASINALINGEELSETNCRRLFVRTLNFRIMGETESGYKPKGEPKYTIKMHLLNGDDMLMELYEINDRQYAISVDGKTDYYVYKKNVTTLVQAFETIMNGRELVMSYDS